jgi:hypothetical protein
MLISIHKLTLEAKNISSFVSIPCSLIYRVFYSQVLLLESKLVEESRSFMSSTKRVILADGSRLLREMLHHALDQADHLKVVDEIPNYGELPVALQRLDPEWVIVPLAYSQQVHNWLDSCMEDHPAVRFIFLSPGQNLIKMKWQTSYEEEYFDLSLREFIHILEKDLQHT